MLIYMIEPYSLFIIILSNNSIFVTDFNIRRSASISLLADMFVIFLVIVINIIYYYTKQNNII